MAYGPERFFYDKRSYTGVHKNGGPTTIDAPTVKLSDHLDRSPADVRGVKLGGMGRTSSFRGSSESRPDWNVSSSMEKYPGRSVEFTRAGSGRSINSTSFSSNEILRTSSSSSKKPAVSKAGYGPERFFYDTSSYTGVHKNGGPTTIDFHRVELKSHLDRSPADARGVKLSNGSASSAGREMLRASSSGRNLSVRGSAERATSPSQEKENVRSSSSRRLDRSQSGRQLYGPERFFYDKSSYTGVYSRGGPSMLDNNRVELSNLLDRSPADVRGVKRY